MTETPVKQNPIFAKNCFEEDFKAIDDSGLPALYEWNLLPNFADLILYVDIWSRSEDGAKLDDYHLKLDMSYYRTWPPGVTYVNPETHEFDPPKDLKWMPKLVSPPPEVGVGYHASYPLTNGERKQMICNTMTLEYYQSNHNPPPEQKWDPSKHNFGTTLLTLDVMLRKPYYGGRGQ